jgi:hypothetical protein
MNNSINLMWGVNDVVRVDSNFVGLTEHSDV